PATHLDYHPFPTRRSSDLKGCALSGGTLLSPREGRNAGGGRTVFPSAQNQSAQTVSPRRRSSSDSRRRTTRNCAPETRTSAGRGDRKSTRLNSSHVAISYA